MDISTCKNCGAEYDLERAPRFCRRCGTPFFPVPPRADPRPEGDREAAFQELVAFVDSALPKNFHELTHDQLKEHLIQAIWGQTNPKSPLQRSDPDMDVVQELEQWVRRGFGPKLMPLRTVTLLREYHLRKDEGEVHHLRLTPKEAEKLQMKTAAYGCEIIPCECEDIE